MRRWRRKDTALCVESCLPEMHSSGPVPPEVHRTITDPRTRHAIPVVDFNPVFPFISPFINADMIRTKQDLRAWNAARDSAALTMNHALNGGALAYIHATDTGTPGELLLQDLVRSDFLLACNRFVLSEHESSQQGDGGRGQTGRPGAPAGTHEEAKKSVRTPTGELESLSSILWESVGVYGARSVELRAAFLAAVLKVLGDDMKKAGAGNEQLQPTERLTQSHDALTALLPRISLHTVLLKLLQQRPALLEHISPHSDLLASATYVYETGGAALDDTEESVDGGGNGDDDGAGGAGQPELHRRSSSGMRLVRQLADTASKSRADALDFVENQSEIFFRKLRFNLYDACAQVNTENAQFSKVAAVLKEAAFIRLVSLYFSALSNALAHVPQDVKGFPEFLRESYRANVAATLSLIVVSNSPPAAAHMDRLVWDIIEQTAAANHEMIIRTFENKHGSFEERQWLSFNALRFQLSDTITPSTMEQWFQAHPEAQKSLSRRSVLVFRLPSLHDLREGDTPVIPELETTPPPYQTVLLYGTSDFSEPAECIAPFCQETDLPPADHNLLESWTRDITHGIKHSLRALNEVAVRDVFDVKVLTEHLCRLLLFDLTLIRLQYLTRDRPELLTTSGPVQQAFAQLRYSSAAQWEALGVFGPLSAEIRQHLLRFLMPPDDLAMQKACDATLADTVAERIQAQRRALNARWKRIPLLPVLKTWLQEHPELLSSPYLSSTSPLLIALQRLPSRRALGLSGARDVTATASDHSTSVQTATDLAVQDDRGDAASAPTVDLKGDDEEVDDGAAVDEAPTVDAAVESYPSEAPEEIQTGSPAATPESPPEHDDSLSADGVDDETSDSGRRSADLQAAEALLSLGSAPIVWRSDENEAAVTGAADPDPQGQVTEGHDAYQKAMAGAPGEPHGALHIEGESSDEDLPLDLSHKTGHAHESPGSSGTRGSASQFLHEPGDDSDFSEGRHPLGISLTTRHMYQSDATLDASSGAGYFADESDDDDTLSGEELPLDLSVRTGQAGPSSGQSDTGGEGAGEFAHASDNDDIISDVDQPLDLSAKSRGKPSDSEDEQPMDLSG
ncbi:hypothetical protein TGGT1_213445 [Toxoplasma gondii GT1]|uniref:Uncharacterized protein n=1 Tax=Toxoplasma gondii (strain ATCC 50853 / GT1) TaxID=507601 RepID=S7UNF0_TOXGG|nr:hypothetical protein TGGT1_213445 [Toxoplasma gondii GT1]